MGLVESFRTSGTAYGRFLAWKADHEVSPTVADNILGRFQIAMYGPDGAFRQALHERLAGDMQYAAIRGALASAVTTAKPILSE